MKPTMRANLIFRPSLIPFSNIWEVKKIIPNTFSIPTSPQSIQILKSNNLLIPIPNLLSHLFNPSSRLFQFTNRKCQSPVQLGDFLVVVGQPVVGKQGLSLLLCLVDLISEVGDVSVLCEMLCFDIVEVRYENAAQVLGRGEAGFEAADFGDCRAVGLMGWRKPFSWIRLSWKRRNSICGRKEGSWGFLFRVWGCMWLERLVEM